MAYKLTITDLETGKIEQEKVCDGIMGAIFSRGQDHMPTPEAFFLGHKLSGIEVVSLLMALDESRKALFAENPSIALGYRFRDQFFSTRTVVDISEIKKQFSAK